MSQISDIENPWRRLLLRQPAQFRDVIFHVEVGNRTSGRRTVVHEYPKRPDSMGPYAEDMGRHAIRFAFTGYLIYRPSNAVYEYTSQRKRLYDALEQEDAGRLIHPVFCPGGMLVMVERYTMTETRERGGYTAFEMQFVQAGSAVKAEGVKVDTTTDVKTKADNASNAAKTILDSIPADI